MIELSTIIPNPKTRPDKEIILIVIFKTKKNRKERIRASGMVRTTSNGDLKSRMKKNIMIQANRPPYIRLLTMLLIE
jgi:hypothetical protein